MILNEKITAKSKIVESDKTKLPKGVLLRCQYPICNIGEMNANNRIYEKDVWEKVLNDSEIKEKMTSRRLYGQAEHPEATQGNLELTSHVVCDTFINEKDNRVYQTYDVVNTPSGKIIQALFEADAAPGVSTRAEGDLEEIEITEADGNKKKAQKVIADTYRYCTTDFTCDPSTSGVIPEKVESNVVETITQLVKDGKMNLNEKKFATKILNSVRCKECKCGKDCKVEALVKGMEEKKIDTLKAEKDLPKSGIYTCRSCGAKFDDPADLNVHHHCKKCAKVEESKINETVQELVGEVSGVDRTDQEILNWAIDHAIIDNEWPEEEDMIDAMSHSEEMKSKKAVPFGEMGLTDYEGVDLGDIKSVYLKYVLLPQAKEAYNKIEVNTEDADELSSKEDLEIEGTLEGEGEEVWSVIFEDGETISIKTDDVVKAWKAGEKARPDVPVIGVKRIKESVKEEIRHVEPGEYVVTFYDGGNVKIEAESKVDAMKKAREKYPEKRVANVVLHKETGQAKDIKDESKLEETENINKMYKDAGLPSPEGKGMHTKAFHKLAIEVAKGYVKGGDSPSAALDKAYPTAMKQLGKEKAVQKSHRKNEAKIEETNEILLYGLLAGFLGSLGINLTQEVIKKIKDYIKTHQKSEAINIYKTVSGSRTGITEEELEKDEDGNLIDSETKEAVIIDKEKSGSALVAKESVKEAKITTDIVKSLFKSIDTAFAQHLTGMYEDRISIAYAGKEVGLELSDLGKQIIGEPEKDIDNDSQYESVIDEMKVLKEAGVHVAVVNKDDKFAVVLKGQGPDRLLTTYDSKEEALTKGQQKAGQFELDFKDLSEMKQVKEELDVPEQHQRKIAISILKMSDVGARIAGGMTKEKAREFLKKIGWSDEKIASLEESKNILDISNKIIDLKVSEASTRADLEFAINELAKSGSILAENEILQSKLNATTESLSAGQSESDSLRVVVEKKAKEISDLNKKIDEVKSIESTLQARHIAHQEEITKTANESIVIGRNQVVQEYFDTKLKEHRLQVDENTRALLEDYQNLQDVDNLLEKLTEIARRSALHSKPLTEVKIQREVTVDPEQNKIDESVGQMMKRFSRR